MFIFNNFLVYGLLLVSTATAIPTSATELALNETESLSSPLERRKNSNKCEAWFHVDTSNEHAWKDQYTEKWRISLLDKPGNVMGYDFNWANKGNWYATNPNYFIKIKTTHGLELWVEGVSWKMLNEDVRKDIRTLWIKLHYGDQHFWVSACENWKYKAPAISNGQRREFDMWCEFDC